MVEKKIEAIQRCVEQAASGDEEQSPMQFGFLAPHNCEGKGRSKGCHCEKRNDQERLGIGLVKSVRVEATHYNSGRCTQRNHCRAKCCSEPPEQAVPSYISRSD